MTIVEQKPLLTSFGILNVGLLNGFVPNPEVHILNPVANLEEARDLCRTHCRSVIVIFQRDTRSALGISNHLMQIDYLTTVDVPHVEYSEGTSDRPPQMIESDVQYSLNSGCHTGQGRLKGGPITTLYVSNIDVLTNKVDEKCNPGPKRPFRKK